MQFAEVVDTLALNAHITHAQHAIRAEHGKTASRWLAAQAGISQRTARRWLSTDLPRSRTDTVARLANRLFTAAQRLRTAHSIDFGAVAVTYDGHHEGTRHIGPVPVDPALAHDLHTVATHLETGSLAAAADALSVAALAAYSPGLEDTLAVDQYDHGIDITP
ncbi:hypothetical protein [Umezawaea sp. Da 62-37]|uniref:hypothetical protein n=1 Tax=Umezawaea sp. Da 62-37 TaxID=3075927 RepID=UPI0028F70FD1|nr:hypothetical protein [Umezawaea sp. Da 62-37]WNV86644.1 hypothetical protein RM788_52455 [Umezawaea sp. Da 62-37]WNV86773.1 hypothetical protein RM788_00350 [Umezawaea sp. Da 62-37]